MDQDAADVSNLVKDLQNRIDLDYHRMARWRYFHRDAGILFTLLLLTLPLILAAGIISSESLQGKIIALLIALVGGLNAAFQPMLHSLRRRADMNNSRRLLDSFRAAIARKQENREGLLDVFEQYSERFAQLYEARGGRLLDAELPKQHPQLAGAKKIEEETGRMATAKDGI